MFNKFRSEENIHVKDMYNSKVIIDINEYLMEIEELCLMYKDYHVDSSCLFVINNRFPVECKADIGCHEVSSTPFYPIVSAALAKEAIAEYFGTGPHRRLFISNPLLPEDKVPEKLLLENDGLESVVKNFMDRRVNSKDLIYILDILDSIMVKLEFYKLPKGFIFDINIDSKYFIIKPMEHICEYRMKEAGYL